ncbi:MAG: hypothetical protein ACERLG_00725 [Sedimentibacter sp.]
MINNFDEFFNIAEKQGKEFASLPYKIRDFMYRNLDNEQYESFAKGKANAETIKKAQSVYDQWYEETHPTDADYLKQKDERQFQNKIFSLNMKLDTAHKRLAKLDEIVKYDGVVQYGSREKLRNEIKELERQLQINGSPKETDSTDIDWIDNFLK